MGGLERAAFCGTAAIGLRGYREPGYDH
jgi:hypothetical protein